MRTTVTLDDKVLEEARGLTGIKETADLVRAGMQALIYQESVRRLIALGGTMPEIEDIPRRDPWSEDETRSQSEDAA